MQIFKYLSCSDCKARKEVEAESRKPVCLKCKSSNVKYGNKWYFRYQYTEGKETHILKRAVSSKKANAEKALSDAKDGKEFIRLRHGKAILFGAAADQYLEHCKHQAGYENKVHHLKHFKALWEKKAIYEVSPEAIRVEHNSLSHKKTASTADHYLATLKSLYTFAEQNGHIDYSVLHDIRKVKMFKVNNDRQRYLTVIEYKKLIKGADADSCQDLTDIINFAIFTGLRQANVLGCRHDQHVDKENGLLKYAAKEMKGEKIHIIPMSPIIQEMVARRPRSLSSPYLFFNGKGEAYSRYTISDAFSRACDKAGIKDCRFHDLRHTLASWLAMSGSNASHIQEILGHADLKMTARYTHLSMDSKRAALGNVEVALTGGER